MLWDLNEGKHLYTLDGGDIINALCFSPNRYWLCAATGPSIKIWVRHCSVLGPSLSPSGLGSSAFGSCRVWSDTFTVEILALDRRSWRRSSPGGASPPGSGRAAATEARGLVPRPRRVGVAVGQSHRAVMKHFNAI